MIAAVYEAASIALDNITVTKRLIANCFIIFRTYEPSMIHPSGLKDCQAYSNHLAKTRTDMAFFDSASSYREY